MSRAFAGSLGVLCMALAAGGAQAADRSASSAAPASAQVVAPLNVSAMSLLSFGWVTSSARGGSVTVSPTGAVTATNGAHVALGVLAGPAAFHVRGEKGWAYSVALPRQLRARPILASRHAADLVVSDFAYRSQNGGSSTGRLDQTGRDLLKVGATLQVPARSAPGFYALTVPVIVDYD